MRVWEHSSEPAWASHMTEWILAYSGHHRCFSGKYCWHRGFISPVSLRMAGLHVEATRDNVALPGGREGTNLTGRSWKKNIGFNVYGGMEERAQ